MCAHISCDMVICFEKIWVEVQLNVNSNRKYGNLQLGIVQLGKDYWDGSYMVVYHSVTGMCWSSRCGGSLARAAT
jgi:hypothetical protein